MDFSLPADLVAYLAELDRFIAATVKPLEQQDDNIRFFDHRREWARTDFEKGGLPRHEWEALLRKVKDLADAAGHLRFAIPKRYGGKDGSNLWMAVIREHFATKGLGLHNDLQNEHSIVGNLPIVTMLDRYGRDDQKAMIEGSITGKYRITFGLTEPDHGSDATHMETRAVQGTRDGKSGWIINGEKMWTTGMHVASHCALFARTSGSDGDARGITCFLVPANSPGVKVEEYMWTFNMPTDHPRVSFTDVFVSDDALFGEIGRGLSLAQCFVHENRIRQAASSLGAAVYCINESVKYARERKPFGEELARNQGIQFPLVELATQAEMLRLLIRKTAWEMDQLTQAQVEHTLSDKVSMCNYWANRLCCEAADRAMQVHGGMGYSRHKAFEHIYRHHRRYRITEGSEEIQKRKVAGFLFGYMGAGETLMEHLDVHANGSRFHVARIGQGRPLLLLHGWPEFWLTWEPVMQRLADRFQLIAPDLRGFGDSDKPDGPYGPDRHARDMLALLDALELDRIGVVGHDVGGAVMQPMARQAPERLTGLFFFGFVYPGIGARMGMPDRLNEIWYQSFNQMPMAPDIVGATRDTCRAYIGHFLRHWAHRKDAFDDVLEAFTENFMKPGNLAGGFAHYRASHAGRMAMLKGEAPVLPPIAVPTCVRWAEHDPIFPYAWTDRLSETFGNLDLALFPGVGHFAHREAPDRAAAEVAKFFDRIWPV